MTQSPGIINIKDAAQMITPREKDVLLFLSKGLTYKETSEQMGVTAETIKKHLKNIYRKLKVKNKIEALNRVKLL